VSLSTDSVWVDGTLANSVPADDRGLNLADGVFETLRVEEGKVALANSHRDRLGRGLKLLAFSEPDEQAENALKLAVDALNEALPNATGSLRVTVTRGSGPRGYAPPDNPQIRVISRFAKGLPVAAKPARAAVSPIFWAEQPQFAGAKLLARTEQVMALNWAKQAGYDDAVMTTADGRCISTASGNIFCRQGQDLFTPRLTSCGIAGTRRRAIVDYWAQALGYTVAQTDITVDQLDSFDEVFSCNAIQGVRSLAAIDAFTFGDHSAALALAPCIHGEYPL